MTTRPVSASASGALALTSPSGSASATPESCLGPRTDRGRRPVTRGPAHGSPATGHGSPVTSHVLSPGAAMLAFYDTLVATLRPRSVSDRTCFRRVAQWLGDGIAAGRFNEQIYPRVLLYASDAAGSSADNPRAVFMATLRKELGYVARRA